MWCYIEKLIKRAFVVIFSLDREEKFDCDVMLRLTYFLAERAVDPCCCGKRPNKTVTMVFVNC